MKNKKIADTLPITRQRSTHSPSNSNTASPLEFTRPTNSVPTSNGSSLPASSSSSQGDDNATTRRYKSWVSAYGRPNASQQLRLALINEGKEYTYETMQKRCLGESNVLPPRRTIQLIRDEFGFGMTRKDRDDLFRTMRTDISIGEATTRYSSKAFTNPSTVAALRAQALEWSKVEGHNIYNIGLNDTEIKNFLRELAADIPKKHQQAASALIDQPPEYRQPLPGTIAAQLVQSLASQDHVPGSASNQAWPVVQASEDVYSPNANASSYPANLSVPSTAAKRSYSPTNGESTSYGNQSPTFKRSRPDFENQTSSSSEPRKPQSFSYGFTPTGIGQANRSQLIEGDLFDPLQSQPHQLQIPPAYNLETIDYQPHLFQDTSIGPPQPHLPSQSQLSSWSASNGMSYSTLQQSHQQPQVSHDYNSGNMNHQSDVFQNGQFFDPSHFQPTYYMQGSNSGPMTSQYSSYWSAPNEINRPDVHQQSQPAFYMHDSNEYAPQTFQNSQFNQGNAHQGPYANGPFSVDQLNYSVHGASPSLTPVVTQDDGWDEILQTIEKLTPLVPATCTQSTPTLPMTTADNQATQGPTTSMPTQQP